MFDLRLELRIKAIEERQRAYEMHDPSCPTYKYPEYDIKPCNCWLSERKENGSNN